MIVSPGEIDQLLGFLPKLFAFIGATRPVADQSNPIAEFIDAHATEIKIIEKISDFLFPGSGSAEAILVLVLRYSHPMDEAEAAEWMNRQNTET